MNDLLNKVGLWASVALVVLCWISTGMGWNAYASRSGGDAAGKGMERGVHGLFLIALNVAAFVGAGCFALALIFPTGAVHLLARFLGWLLLPPTLVLFVGLLRK
ncbi:hypothetical protein [Melittangium boletus]|uniref:Uncharacterized protein n=1 Tax=Melittangium boletus DSM 14713 TaxID=1294270 RepID=A0A250IM48_9BACT|nr:hypothetical protein [Melittangium boletus]ATB32825.1 hypothetical protein MEBOL_006314 [Melittangium boletus DSM 14713]